MLISVTTMESSMEALQKAKNRTTTQSSNTIHGHKRNISQDVVEPLAHP
jgi:hypothetical protein